MTVDRPPLYRRPQSSTTSLELSPNKQSIDRIQFLLTHPNSENRFKKEIAIHCTNTCPKARILMNQYNESDSSRSEKNSLEDGQKVEKSSKKFSKMSKKSEKSRNPSGPENQTRGRDRFKKSVNS